jgi:hypothetical protein
MKNGGLSTAMSIMAQKPTGEGEKIVGLGARQVFAAQRLSANPHFTNYGLSRGL